MNCVNWHEAKEYAEFQRARLPSEAEWEYAARAGRPTKYAGSDNIGSVAWSLSNAGDGTHPVRGKNPNAFGLYDMSGNVFEWCEDDCHDSYDLAPADGTAWIDSPRDPCLVIRGGSWAESARSARVAIRYYGVPGFRRSSLGFRLARSS